MAKDFEGAVGGVLSRNNGRMASWRGAARDTPAPAPAPEPEHAPEPAEIAPPAHAGRGGATVETTVRLPARCWEWVQSERLGRARRGEAATYSAVLAGPLADMVDALESGRAGWGEVAAAHEGAARTKGWVSVDAGLWARVRAAVIGRRAAGGLPAAAVTASNVLVAAIDRAAARGR